LGIGESSICCATGDIPLMRAQYSCSTLSEPDTPVDITLWETHMLQHIQRLMDRRKDEQGASAVEYGLLVAAIAALIVIIVFALGGVVKEVFTDTCEAIDTGAKTSGTC
jgi:pilus assembly protein Flp/PilA